MDASMVCIMAVTAMEISILLLWLEDSLIRRLDQVLDLRAHRVQSPGQAAVNGREEIEENSKNNNGGNGPFTIKAVLHGKDYTSRKRSYK